MLTTIFNIDIIIYSVKKDKAKGGTVTENVANYANATITTNVVNQDYQESLTAFGVTEDLADGIEALTAYANGVTGESDTIPSVTAVNLGI